jgi:hypothetical protein
MGVAAPQRPGTQADLAAAPEPFRDPLAALARLGEKLDGLQDVLALQKERIRDLEGRVRSLQERAGVDSFEGLERSLDRLEALTRERDVLMRERQTVLSSVEGLIRKVDSLGERI